MRSNNYTRSAKDVFKKIGHHQINIEFEFDEQPYFFYRMTNTPNKVFQSDESYSTIINEMSLKEYREFLFSEYNIGIPYLTFNDVVERFIRIYGHNSHNEHKPLSKSEREWFLPAIDNLVKLLGKYEAIQLLRESEAEHSYTPSKTPDRNVSDLSLKIGENKEAIYKLEERQTTIAKKNEDASLRAWGIDQEKSRRLVEVINEIRQLEELRQHLESQLRAIKNNLPTDNEPPSKDFSALLRFFPNADVDALNDVEDFHAKINSFLRAD